MSVFPVPKLILRKKNKILSFILSASYCHYCLLQLPKIYGGLFQTALVQCILPYIWKLSLLFLAWNILGL